MIIKAIAWLIRPLYLIHSTAYHGAASKGALFYVNDLAEYRQIMLDTIRQLSIDTNNELKIHLEEYIEKMWQHEKQELTDWLDNTVNDRIKQSLESAKKGEKS